MLDQICEAVREAGAIILSAETYRGDGMQKSGDHNYVTEYDLKVQKYLRGALGEICPEAAFCGEEDGEQGRGELAWVVDPIDGTSNFIHGTGMSCVSVALTRFYEDLPVKAAIFNPYTNELFTAERGKGAFCNGKRLHVSDHDYDHALISFGSTPYDRSMAAPTLEMLHDVFMGALDIRRTGSAALDLAYLAAGRSDGFFEMRLQPWDYAAGELMIEEAGGIITRFNGLRPSLTTPSSILAGTSSTYPVMKAIAERYTHLVY